MPTTSRAHIAPLLASCLLTTLLGACMTLPGARPLSPGEHEVGVTVGGPFVEFGGANVPLPNAIVEGRSGIATLRNRPLDLQYGLNATAIGFGIAQLHLGASYLLLEQENAIPAISLTNRIFFATNALTPQDKAPGTKQAWGAHQLELTASYLVKGQLLYLGVSQYTDLGYPQLLLSPALGVQFDPGEKKRGIQFLLEARYYAVNQTKELTTVSWTSAPRGAIGVGFGLSYKFGQARPQGGCSCSVR